MKSKTSFALIASFALLFGAGCMGTPAKKASPNAQVPGVNTNNTPSSQIVPPDQAPKGTDSTDAKKVSPSEGPAAKPNPDSDLPAPAKGTIPEGGGPKLEMKSE